MPDPTDARSVRSARRAQRSERGQTLVEVALVLPIFILTLVAVIEFGWFSAVAAATSSASREAARYGSTVGDEDGDSAPNYADCSTIRNHARETSESLITLIDTDIAISWDDGTAALPGVTCGTVDESDVDRWDRVVVTVTFEYEPLVPLLEPIIGTHPLVSTDRRTIGKP